MHESRELLGDGFVDEIKEQCESNGDGPCICVWLLFCRLPPEAFTAGKPEPRSRRQKKGER
jgi:hypothetical protein